MTNTYGRPGVSVTEVLAPRDTGFTSALASRSVLIADLDRGPLAPTTVGSWHEFRNIFGDWRDNSPRGQFGHKRNASVDAAYLFFANNPVGGAPLTILRVTHADAEYARGVITGSSEEIAVATAISPGTWGNRLRVTMAGNYAASGAFSPADFDPEAYNTPTGFATGALEVIVELQDAATGVWDIVERFSNLSLDERDRRFAEFVVNGASNYVSLEIIGKYNSKVNNPVALLTGGTNGTIATDLVNSLAALDQLQESLTISYSGHWDSADLGTVSTYCKNRGDSFHIIDMDDSPGTNVQEIASWVYELNQKDAFSAVYYPSVIINDPAAGPNNVRRKAPCGGAVLGVFAANDSNYGMWKTPAGVTAGVRGIVGPSQRFNNVQLDQLNSLVHPVNPIRVVQGVGPCIMGGRTLDQTHADRYVGIRRSFSYIRSRLAALTEFAVFEVNGPDLWETINLRLENFLGLYYQQGALRGAREYEAFYVLCDGTNNTENTISAGEVHVEVGVALEYPAEFIVIKLTHNQTSVRVD